MLAAGCGGDAPSASISNDSGPDGRASTEGKKSTANSKKSSSTGSDDGTKVVVETNLGNFEITLDADKAPLAVDNFLYNYVHRGAYDNTIVHYCSDEFLIAGGFQVNQKEIPPRAPVRNQSDNGLKNVKRTVALSHTADYPHSASSHFFINVQDNPYFDYDDSAAEEDKKWGYTVFGRVTDGWNVVEKIARARTHDQGDFVSTPVKPVIIKSVRQY